MAVVDSDGGFLGLVPRHRMLRVLLAEHEEDLARLGGYLARTESARSAAEETVLIRGLAVGVELRDVVLRELATGLVVRAVMAAAFFPFELVVWGEGRVAVAVGLSLAASCSIATLVAMVVPWVFWRLGADPAFGCGPLATVVQDPLSITVYLL
ncbi:MAG: magnesium transporter, partial [Actinomycetota bacterium]|nr:magnesium transporter [Actinomycetota bacterium]